MGQPRRAASLAMRFVFAFSVPAGCRRLVIEQLLVLRRGGQAPHRLDLLRRVAGILEFANMVEELVVGLVQHGHAAHHDLAYLRRQRQLLADRPDECVPPFRQHRDRERPVLFWPLMRSPVSAATADPQRPASRH